MPTVHNRKVKDKLDGPDHQPLLLLTGSKAGSGCMTDDAFAKANGTQE